MVRLLGRVSDAVPTTGAVDGDLMNPDVECVKCGASDVSEKQMQRGNAKTASSLLMAARVAVPLGLLMLLVDVAAPADLPRLPYLISLLVLVFGVFCARDGRRAIPHGPFLPGYECQACGHSWIPAGVAAKPRKSSSKGPRSATPSQRRGRVRRRSGGKPGSN